VGHSLTIRERTGTRLAPSNTVCFDATFDREFVRRGLANAVLSTNRRAEAGRHSCKWLHRNQPNWGRKNRTALYVSWREAVP
jgi:hypothetical protein